MLVIDYIKLFDIVSRVNLIEKTFFLIASAYLRSMLCEYKLFKPCFRFSIRDFEMGMTKNKTLSPQSCREKCQSQGLNESYISHCESLIFQQSFSFCLSFGRSMPNFSQLKTANFSHLVHECKYISTNLSIDYEGYYEDRPLCDFQIDLTYDFTTYSWIATASNDHQFSHSKLKTQLKRR